MSASRIASTPPPNDLLFSSVRSMLPEYLVVHTLVEFSPHTAIDTYGRHLFKFCVILDDLTYIHDCNIPSIPSREVSLFAFTRLARHPTPASARALALTLRPRARHLPRHPPQFNLSSPLSCLPRSRKSLHHLHHTYSRRRPA